MKERRRDELARRLLVSPFDIDARREYARILAELGSLRDALEQWRVVAQQDPISAEPLVEIATCLFSLGDRHGARRSLDDAKACGDAATLMDRIEWLDGELLEAGSGAHDRMRHHDARRESPRSRDAISFDDVAGLGELEKILRRRIIDPFLNPGLFAKFGRKSGGGVLLYGPPGCGKTLIARAIASECGATFRAVGISDVLNQYLGQSERNLAHLFALARERAPSVLFFDELDAMAYTRSKSDSHLVRGVVNEFLAQLDGMHGRNDGVLVLGASNMPWDVDPAMKRPGRFERQVFVPPPDVVAREAMFRRKLERIPLADVEPADLARRTERFTGADIDAVIDRAKDFVLDDIMDTGVERPLAQADLLRAIDHVVPSSSDWMQTARNLVQFGNVSGGYDELAQYLKKTRPR